MPWKNLPVPAELARPAQGKALCSKSIFPLNDWIACSFLMKLPALFGQGFAESSRAALDPLPCGRIKKEPLACLEFHWGVPIHFLALSQVGFSLHPLSLESVLVCKNLAQSSESRRCKNIREGPKGLGVGEAAAGRWEVVPRDAPAIAGDAEIAV